MRAVVQRVERATVRVDGDVVAHIGPGLLILVGVAHDDRQREADWLAEKLADLRIFEGENGKLDRSVRDVRGEVLVVSQFTLYADTRKGRRPSFTAAAEPRQAEQLYSYLANRFTQLGIPAQRGRFGAHMEVELVNDGPVTLILEVDPTPDRVRTGGRRIASFPAES
jgi:D-tyrosyl-tRNA(Tyr) deacylase